MKDSMSLNDFISMNAGDTPQQQAEPVTAPVSTPDEMSLNDFIRTQGAAPTEKGALRRGAETLAAPLTAKVSAIPEIVSGVGERLQQRGRDVANIAERTTPAILPTDSQTKQPIGTSVGQFIGTQLGALGDVIGGVAELAVTGIPNEIKEPFNKAIEGVVGSQVAKNAIGAINLGVDGWNEYKKNNEKDAASIEAIGNVFLAGSADNLLKGAPSKFVKEGVETGGKIGKEAFKDLSAEAGNIATSLGETAASMKNRSGEFIEGLESLAKGDIKSVIAKAPALSADEIKVLSGFAYDRSTEAGGVLKAEFANKFIKSLEDIDNLEPQAKALRGKDTPTSIALERIGTFKDQPMTLQGAQQVDEVLGDLVDTLVNPATGNVNAEGRKILQIQSRFRRQIEDIQPNMVDSKTGFIELKKGRDLWSASIRQRDIEKIIARSEGTNSPATSLRTGFQNLRLNNKRLRGFSPQERELINNAAKTGSITELLKTGGSRLLPLIAVGSGGGLGAAAAATAGSTAARSGAAKLQLNRAAKVTKGISSRVDASPIDEAKARLTKHFDSDEINDLVKSIKGGKVPRELRTVPVRERRFIIDLIRGK